MGFTSCSQNDGAREHFRAGTPQSSQSLVCKTLRVVRSVSYVCSQSSAIQNLRRNDAKIERSRDRKQKPSSSAGFFEHLVYTVVSKMLLALTPNCH